MPSNNINILVTAKDAASPALRRVSKSLDDTGQSAAKQSTLMQRLSDNWGTFASISVGAGIALRGLYGQAAKGVKAVNDLQSAMLGLNSVARHFHQDANKAKQAARDLASDGLMTVADAATGLKNLLASGFELPQAIKLMERFKDSAAFNRQASLSFGDAIRSATEGIKNGNSILVDNAGITKNLSVILTEAGYSAQDLMKATTDAGVRQALFNGIIKESNAFVGDAARLTDTAAGKQAEMAAQTTVLYQEIGQALQPALLSFLQTVTPIIKNVSEWIQRNQGLASGIIIATGVILAMITALGVMATAIRTASTVMAVFGPTAVASFGKARTALLAFRALAATPTAMGGVIVAGALADIALVMKAIQSVRVAISDMNEARAAAESNARAINAATAKLRNLQRNGTAAQRKRATEALSRVLGGNSGGSGWAEGGFTGRGSRNEVAGVVHKGEYVLPQKMVDQNTGLPKGIGGTNITISGTVNLYTKEAADAFWNRIDKTQRLAQMGMA